MATSNIDTGMINWDEEVGSNPAGSDTDRNIYRVMVHGSKFDQQIRDYDEIVQGESALWHVNSYFTNPPEGACGSAAEPLGLNYRVYDDDCTSIDNLNPDTTGGDYNASLYVEAGVPYTPFTVGLSFTADNPYVNGDYRTNGAEWELDSDRTYVPTGPYTFGEDIDTDQGVWFEASALSCYDSTQSVTVESEYEYNVATDECWWLSAYTTPTVTVNSEYERI